MILVSLSTNETQRTQRLRMFSILLRYPPFNDTWSENRSKRRRKSWTSRRRCRMDDLCIGSIYGVQLLSMQSKKLKTRLM
ncbi:hypothetical protein M422DRAFT_36252, partial [Sphaerobolus stellatus SS14]